MSIRNDAQDAQGTIDLDQQLAPQVLSAHIEQLLTVAFVTPMGDPIDPNCIWGLNVILWGDPGIGKSGRIRAGANAVGLPVQPVYAPSTLPENVSGALVPDMQGGAKILPLLPGVKRLMQEKCGVLVIEELSCARPAVQASFLGVALDRRVGEIQLHPEIRVLSAANPITSAAGGWELSPPTANRFCHFYVPPPTADEWGRWLMSERPPAVEAIDHAEARIRAAWAGEWLAARSLVKGFIERIPSLLYALPPEGKEARGGAWPSPRTWEFATRALATCRILGMPDMIVDNFIEGCVGAAAAGQFASWRAQLDLPSPKEMLQHGWSPDLKRLDRTMAAYGAMTAYVVNLPKEDRLRVGHRAWEVLDQGCSAELLDDIVLPSAVALVKAGFSSRAGDTQANSKIAQRVKAHLAKSGIYNLFVEQ